MSREDDLLDQRHEEVLAAIRGVHTRLDALNGRTRLLESKVSVLEERTPPSRAETNVVSALVSAVISGISMYFSNK